MRIIGDVHGHYYKYHNIIKECEYSIQLGDFGFDYITLLYVNPTHHKIIPGNHDNYDIIHSYPHILQDDFGITELDDLRFGYIRGAESVDRMYRTEGVSWWKDEEMTYKRGCECINFFKHNHVNMILSHDCPFFVVPSVITNPYKTTSSTTNSILDGVFEVCKPSRWFFGHHHNIFSQIIEGCHFRCLNELEFADI
jgi:hypothetical protein